jgi:1A family penicillin-binding protein
MPGRKYYRKIYQKNKKKRKNFLVFKALGIILLLLLLGGTFLFFSYAKDLPRPEKFIERRLSQSTKIYDSSGEILLYEIYGEEKRTVVALGKVPEYLKRAVIVTEDANFYHHFGIDLKGVIRSILINLKIMEPIYGGSTIPQQLIRSTFFSTEKTIERKIREIVLALELDRRYSKDQILEWYLNQVPFGSNCYGVEAASQTYFKKTVSEISLAEAAALAALIRAPSYLSPYGEEKTKLLNRKDYILDRMAEEGFLTKEESEEAKKEEVEFADVLTPIKAPHFVMYIIENYLKPKYGENLDFLKENGVKVYTSLDWELQQWAEKAIEEGVKNNETYNAHNASLVAIDPKTGYILAMVGSANYFGEPFPKGCTPGKDCQFDPQFNVAVGTEQNPGRQPGSAFKPFVYATAFKKGYDDTTIVVDEETNFGTWGEKEYIPQNYDGKFRGPVTLRQALAQSINVPSVKVLLNLAGLEDSIKTAEDLGITTLKPPYGPSIVLGGWEVKLLDMVSAYSVFASGGLRIPPVAILRIEDYQGNVVEENKKAQKRVLETEVVELINDILSDNEARAPMFGQSSNLYFEKYQVAAKTGTTQNFRDAWTIGYTSSLSVGVWAGNNDNSSTFKKPGVTLAGPIFHSFMEKALSR